MEGHEFKVVLMRADAEVSDASQSFIFSLAIGNIDSGIRVMEFHDWLFLELWKAGGSHRLAYTAGFFIRHMHRDLSRNFRKFLFENFMRF